VHDIVALERIGWRVVQIQPDLGGGVALWSMTITRRDGDASMTVTAAEPEVALAELVRYAQADAR
jgi:hypothetical protein